MVISLRVFVSMVYIRFDLFCLKLIFFKRILNLIEAVILKINFKNKKNILIYFRTKYALKCNLYCNSKNTLKQTIVLIQVINLFV
jgi:hypothetical protein